MDGYFWLSIKVLIICQVDQIDATNVITNATFPVGSICAPSQHDDM